MWGDRVVERKLYRVWAVVESLELAFVEYIVVAVDEAEAKAVLDKYLKQQGEKLLDVLGVIEVNTYQPAVIGIAMGGAE